MADPRGTSGLLAEFDSTETLLQAVRACQNEGYRVLDAYTPFPVEGLSEELGFRDRWLAVIATAGALLGGGGMFFVQTWMNAIDYPLNVGGRPLFAWQGFVVPAYQIGILTAVLATIVGMLALNGLPRLHHPVFEVPRFRQVSVDRFYLAISGEDPRFDHERVCASLRACGATSIEELPG